VQVTFRASDCTPCRDRARCTRAPVNPRHLTFRPRLQYETQRRLRAEQATPAWRDRYAHRSGIEGTIAQASRRSDLHHARYRGLPKTHLQHVLTALAINLVRVDAWLTRHTPWRQLGLASPDSDQHHRLRKFASRVLQPVTLPGA
jgi:Transposase DDE domain